MERYLCFCVLCVQNESYIVGVRPYGQFILRYDRECSFTISTPVNNDMCTAYPKKYAHGFCFAVLCVVIHWLIFPYPSGLLHWHCGNLTIAPVPAKQPWWIWINTSCECIMNNYITTTKQSTIKPCAYFLGYTVCVGGYVDFFQIMAYHRTGIIGPYDYHITIPMYTDVLCHVWHWDKSNGVLSAASIFCVRTRLMKNIIYNIDSIRIPWLLLLEIFFSLTCEDKQWHFSKLHYNFYRRPSNVSYSMSSTQCSGYRQLGSRFILVQTIRQMVTL